MSTTFDFSQIIEPVQIVLEKYKNVPNLEFEGRLGIYDEEQDVFDTNIGEEYYDKIHSLLESCDTWKNKEEIDLTDYFHNNMRLSVDNTGGSRHCVEKRKLATFTYQTENAQLDFRLSISTENPKKVESFPEKKDKFKQRNKSRNQYTRSNYNYDLTKVVTTDFKKNEASECYEYEVEYNSPDINNTGQVIYSVIMKLLDATYACENFVKTGENKLPLKDLNIQCVKTT